MTWGTSFKAYVFLSHKVFMTKGEVEEELNFLNKEQYKIESKIKMLASATPMNIVPADEEPIEWINLKIDDLLEEYLEKIIKIQSLELFLEYLNDGGNIKGEKEDEQT